MLPIISFCWQEFAPVQVPGATVQDLLFQAQQRDTELFVFHDPEFRYTTVIMPEQVNDVIAQFDLPLGEKAGFAGLFDLIRQEQLIVGSHLSASFVADLVVTTGAEIAFAVDERGTPKGLFLPGIVLQNLPQAGMILYESPASLQADVNRLTSEGDLVGTIRAIERHLTSFHSESINHARPRLAVCKFNGHRHYPERCPCPQHSGSACRPRDIAIR